MKAIKLVSIIFVIILTSLYALFLFALPKFVDINKFEPDIQKAITESSGFKVNTENIKLSTGWNLTVGIKTDRIDAFYPNNEKFAQLKNVEIKLSLLPLIFKQIRLDSINVNSVILKMKVSKDGKYYIEQFLPKNEVEKQSELPFGLKLSENMPNIIVNKYSLALVDSNIGSKYFLNGKNFKIAEFVLNKKIKIETIGQILFDKKVQMNYDIKLNSKVLPTFEEQNDSKSETTNFNIIDLLKELKSIDLNGNLKADLQITGHSDDIKADGVLNISDLTLKVKGQKLPKSFIKTKFNGNQITVDSDINTSDVEQIKVNGFVRYGKNQYIDMNVKSDKILLSNLFDIMSVFLPLVGVSDIHGITANGVMKADFNIKSDLKKINSDGYLKIDNANVFYKLYNVAVRNINADIDFSGNRIGIRESSALINGAPIKMAGAIDTNAYANLSVKADRLPIKGLFATFGLLQVLNENNINSGVITMTATLKGKLDKAKPKADVVIENLKLYNKPSKVNVGLIKAVSKINLNKDNKINGQILVNNLTLKSPDFGVVSVPKTNLIFDDKDFNIEKADAYFNNSKISFKGKVSDYISNKNTLSVEIFGLILANDIKKLLPKESRNSIIANGKLPLIVRILGNLKEQNIEGQILANNKNYISIIDINSLSGRTSLVNMVMKIVNNSIRISDISLNVLGVNRGLSEDFKANLRGAQKIATLKGNITNIQTKTPYINGLNLNIPNVITFSLPTYRNSQIRLKGNINLNGSSKSPDITGNLNILKASLPSVKTAASNLNVGLTKSTINADCQMFVVDNSKMAFSTVIDNNFKYGAKIKSFNLNAETIDLDSLIVAMTALPQSTVGQGTDLGVVLTNGKGKIGRFLMGGLVSNNIVSDFVINNNTLKMNNLTADAYGGKVAGSVNYNLVFGNLMINLQGRNLSAEPAIRGFTGMKNLLEGKLDFDTQNIKLIVGTQSQMMQTLRGGTTFIVSDGQMGTLGKLENLLYAQNILSNNLLKNSLGSITKAVSIKKTGDFKYIKGKLNFSNGWTNIQSVQTSGPAMSTYATGDYNLLNNNAKLIILGRLSNDVVAVLGPIGEFSFSKLLSSIPKIGVITSNIINQMTISPAGENLFMLPDLTPKQSGATKEFKASISGNIESASSVKYFKWLSTPQVQVEPTISPEAQIPTTVDEVHNAVEETVKETPKNVIEKVIPSTPATTSNPYQQKPTGLTDFIDSLPELKIP